MDRKGWPNRPESPITIILKAIFNTILLDMGKEEGKVA